MMAISRPRMHLRYAQHRISVYLSRAKDMKDAFKVCPTSDPCLVVEGQRHTRFPGVPRTKSSILRTIRIHQIRSDVWRVTGLPTTLDAFNAIPRRIYIVITIIGARQMHPSLSNACSRHWQADTPQTIT
jgi:hypothetical protein